MKKLLLPSGWLLALALVSCNPTPEAVCDCIRQSANDFMLKGERPSEAKLVAPCADLIAKLKDNQAATVKIEADYEDVQKALTKKTLLAVDGKTPAFPPLTAVFDSVMLDYAKDYDAATYRYLNRAVTTTATGLLEKTDSTSRGYVASFTPARGTAPGSEWGTLVNVPVSADVSQTLAAAASEIIFDRKRHRSLKFDDRWFDSHLSGTRTYYAGVGIPNTFETRSFEAHQLEAYLKGENNDVFARLAEKSQPGAYQAEKYAPLAAEVRAGN